MGASKEISELIPHRDPFLWVDKVVSFDGETIVTEKSIPAELEVFKGHYPGNPIMPGVLLCEAIFQSGALLVAKQGETDDTVVTGVPVLTRINNAKFKRTVLPGDTVQIKVKITESLSTVFFFKGTLRVGGKVAVQVDFACTMTS
ncbi:MAG: 3-hydroxyacyl-ACP dehydratase FabZ [Desulforhopalus sp.]